jgi:type III restriction enzyme
MKIKFESTLDYQQEAIQAACDLFKGQESCRTEFTVTRNEVGGAILPGIQSDLGIGNRLAILDEDLLSNLREVQLRNGLAPSEELKSKDFTIEMETGTGKTYVYLRTIYELNKRYGFTKFVIVVPSVAIKEGVRKNLQITEEHMKSLYSGVSCEYFLYDSSKLGQVRNYAMSSQIQVMIMTVGAINKFGDGQKAKNVMYEQREETGGEKPIDLIKSTNPIIIVDEPQSVEGGLDGKGKQALSLMNPLCTFRYSATPKDSLHKIYRLDAVDAYERKLVKQIEVAAATIEGGHNKAYIRLISVSNKKNVISAKLALDAATAGGITRKEFLVQDGDSIQELVNREIYRDFMVGDIQVAKDSESMVLRYPGGEQVLRPGQAFGDVDQQAVQCEMIRRTIKEHLDKELRLSPHGIKVLSLFFVDSVEKYRLYDSEGNSKKGEYALIFEDEYTKMSKSEVYQQLFNGVDAKISASDVHNGYFSIDRKKVGGKMVEFSVDTKGSDARDEDTYSLIMKEKERLLSMKEPLKFIFSHSALREGWDNPNVFQICALREMSSEQQRRQTIGRGLRICVNQEGERVRGFEYNTLTVIATESYESFAENLQKEIEQETGTKFGIVEAHQFAPVVVVEPDGKEGPLGIDKSKIIYDHLKSSGYINTQGKVQDSLRSALKLGTFALPPGMESYLPKIADSLRKITGRLEIKNADERKQIKTRQAILHSEEFKALWERIKHKTSYRVKFDSERLIEKCIEGIKSDDFRVSKTRIQWNKAQLGIDRSAISATEVKNSAQTTKLEEMDIVLPDIITNLQDRTSLTRKSIVRILIECGRLQNDFKRNPQQFIDLTAEVINRQKRYALVDGIKYKRIGDDDYYAQELFESEELSGYIKSMVDVSKGVYEQVVYQSDTERSFAEQLENNESVKVYAKLPGWFQVPTPLGPYNPDWAVLITKDGGEQLYFVVETKSSLFTDDLRDKESGKIRCGEAHFSELGDHYGSNPAKFKKATRLNDLLTD